MNMSYEDIIIGTSCYENAPDGNLVSITGDGGNAWGFYGSSYKKLAPSLKLYNYWHYNPDNLSDYDLICYYINEYYNHRLKDLNLYELLENLYEKFGDNIILLCHELPNETGEYKKEFFCHRVVVANYIELETGIIIPEIAKGEDGIIYPKQMDYKGVLRKLMK